MYSLDMCLLLLNTMFMGFIHAFLGRISIFILIAVCFNVSYFLSLFKLLQQIAATAPSMIRQVRALFQASDILYSHITEGDREFSGASLYRTTSLSHSRVLHTDDINTSQCPTSQHHHIEHQDSTCKFGGKHRLLD